MVCELGARRGEPKAPDALRTIVEPRSGHTGEVLSSTLGDRRVLGGHTASIIQDRLVYKPPPRRR